MYVYPQIHLGMLTTYSFYSVYSFQQELSRFTFSFIQQFISIFPFKITPNGKSSMLIRLDENGKIIEILNDFQNELPNACEVLEHDNTLYIGSYYLSYFGKLERLSN
uniref:SJCHGC03613 protein n=1 Tax=Schistosoma japonicum TaxID=6182 RepID=Q5DDE3_SCHJA|nr:SJCHGC03613 protein [Schistosoma japonicum]